jgi:prevent-host-death family protein
MGLSYPEFGGLRNGLLWGDSGIILLKQPDKLAKTGVDMNWQLAEAKNRFSEVVRQALTEGPQRVTCDGGVVVVLSEQEYERITGKRPGIVDQFMNGLSLEGLDLSRDESPMRDIEL